ncbi:hypothetical protein AVEN_202301-1 [Araneus ventricosus]|uniref:Uncharacterized protein n=1 Tax=Araneus ventricosus TaxID=182803 RepID=A0A4Y2I3Z3_ARAVE|nr:hypothetical protein AVEN_202301-1 [Araneus ventricosus]
MPPTRVASDNKELGPDILPKRSSRFPVDDISSGNIHYSAPTPCPFSTKLPSLSDHVTATPLHPTLMGLISTISLISSPNFIADDRLGHATFPHPQKRSRIPSFHSLFH